MEKRACTLKEFLEKEPSDEQMNGFDDMILETTKPDKAEFKADCTVLEAHKNNIICVHKKGSGANFRKALKAAHIRSLNRLAIKDTSPIEFE